jgi:hypothetical protein
MPNANAAPRAPSREWQYQKLAMIVIKIAAMGSAPPSWAALRMRGLASS